MYTGLDWGSSTAHTYKTTLMSKPMPTDLFIMNFKCVYLFIVSGYVLMQFTFIPMYNTYSFSKSDYAAMLQHMVDLLPEWMFLYDPSGDMVVYHNQKKGRLFDDLAPAPVTLRQLLGHRVLEEDWPILEKNARQLLSLGEGDIHEIRFRVHARDLVPAYRWFSFRQKVFFQDEGSGVKMILCLTSEVKHQYPIYLQ